MFAMVDVEGRRKKAEVNPPPCPPKGGNSGRRKKEEGKCSDSNVFSDREIRRLHVSCP
jgi:hypothetical protein